MHDHVPSRPSDDIALRNSIPDTSVTNSDVTPSAVFEWLKNEIRPVVDDRINDIVDDSSFRERLMYQIRTGGKRIRPGLTLTAAELCGLDRDLALDLERGNGRDIIGNDIRE